MTKEWQNRAQNWINLGRHTFYPKSEKDVSKINRDDPREREPEESLSKHLQLQSF